MINSDQKPIKSTKTTIGILFEYLIEKRTKIFSSDKRNHIVGYEQISNRLTDNPKNHNYLSSYGFTEEDFSNSIKYLEEKGDIFYHIWEGPENGNEEDLLINGLAYKISLKDDFFCHPEIKKAKVKYVTESPFISKGNVRVNKKKYDYSFGTINIRINQEFKLTEKYVIKNITDFDKIASIDTLDEAKLKKGLAMIYAILTYHKKNNSDNMDENKIVFTINKNFVSYFDEFKDKFANICPKGRKRQKTKQAYDDTQTASRDINILRDVIGVLNMKLKIPEKPTGGKNNSDFIYELKQTK